MSRVDVLAVMDDMVSRLTFSTAPDALRDYVEARAAVAELIAASQRAVAAFRENARYPVFTPHAHQECQAAFASLDRVNARIGGDK